MLDLLTAFDAASLTGDLRLKGARLAEDESLVSAVIQSLFTDARARPDDELPAGENDPRGWWGDLLAPVEGDRYGSRLWLLSREKQTKETLNKARQMAAEALQWLVDDGIATAVDIEAEWLRMGTLGLAISITATGAAARTFSFEVEAGGA